MKLHANTLSSSVYWNISFEQGSPYGAMSQEPWDPWKDQTQYETGPRNSSAFTWFIFFCASYVALPLNVLFICSVCFLQSFHQNFSRQFHNQEFLIFSSFHMYEVAQFLSVIFFSEMSLNCPLYLRYVHTISVRLS